VAELAFFAASLPIAVMMTIAEAERILEASFDHIVLRRVPPPSDWQFAQVMTEVRRAVFVDTETTGLNERDEVIELALVPFDYDRETGAIVAIDEA
jgi:DNA polymerase III subunit epsilon